MTNLEQALAALNITATKTQLAEAYQIISRSYRSGQRVNLNDDISALVYMIVRMPATVAVLKRIMQHLDPNSDDIKSLLDLGCGPGSILWASSDILTSLEKLTLVDRAQKLMELGGQLASSHLHKPSWIQEDILSFLSNDKSSDQYDLVTISYVFNELTIPIQRQVTYQAWLKTTKYLLIVEPGTPSGFKNIRAAREHLIDMGAKILAPCTHENKCPMSESDWCHFPQRLTRGKLHQQLKGSLSYEDEKYSYLIATKNDPTARTESRIVKKPLSSKGLVELSLCNANGLNSVKISKRNTEKYPMARKAEWGDSWPD